MSNLHKEKTQTSTPEQSRRLKEVTLQCGANLEATPTVHLVWAAARPLWTITANLADPATADLEV